MKTAICFIIACMTQVLSLYGQTYRAVKTEITVKGKSTDRDWQMVSKNSKCTAEFEFRAKEPAIQSLNFSVAVKDLKGDNDLMNKRAYKALKAYPYSDITYTGKLFTMSHARSNKYLIKTEGNLRIGGVTHAVSIPATLVMNDDGTMSCTGSKSLKMSDYKIKLPEVLVKNMNIQNTVIIDFKLVFVVI